MALVVDKDRKDSLTVWTQNTGNVNGEQGGLDRLVLDYTGFGPITMTAPTGSNPGNTTDRSGEVYENLTLILTYDRINQIHVKGSSGDDVLYGTIDFFTQPGIDTDGADILNGGPGADIMHGGRGSDIYYVDNVGDVIDDDFERYSVHTVYTSLTHYDAPFYVNIVHALTDEDYFFTGDKEFHGAGGDDFFFFVDDNFESDQVFYGGGGNDIYVRPEGVVELAGGGSDIVFSTNYMLSAGSAVEVLTTTDQDSTSNVYLTGNELTQWIYGGAGDDGLAGGGGIDVLIGRQGDDNYRVGSFYSIVVEAFDEGNDVVRVESMEYALAEGVYVETIQGDDSTGTRPLNLWGNSLDNILIGQNGANVLNGSAGADTMSGFGGDDIFFVDQANDQVFEDAGKGLDTVYVTASSYTLAAGVSVEVLSVSNHGFTTAIDLTGNEFDNNVYGNAGSNTLDGRAGSDRMIGFGGADIFAFSTALGATNVDTIVDFAHGTDTIRLASSVFTGLSAGALSADAFNTGAAASDASDRILYDSATGALAFDADGAGGAAATVFAYLSTGLTISSTDFIVA